MFLKSIRVETDDKAKRQRPCCFLLAGPNLPGQKEEGGRLHSKLTITFASVILDSVIILGKRFSRCFQVVTVWVYPVLPHLSPRTTFSLSNTCEDFSEAKTRPGLSYVKWKFQIQKIPIPILHCSWVLRTCVFYQLGSEMWNRSLLDPWGCWSGTIVHNGFTE